MKSAEEKPDVDEVDRNGWTALHVACYEGHFKIINALIHCGAKLNRPNPSGKFKHSVSCETNLCILILGATPISYLVRKIPENTAYFRNVLGKMIDGGASVNCPDK